MNFKKLSAGLGLVALLSSCNSSSSEVKDSSINVKNIYVEGTIFRELYTNPGLTYTVIDGSEKVVMGESGYFIAANVVGDGDVYKITVIDGVNRTKEDLDKIIDYDTTIKFKIAEERTKNGETKSYDVFFKHFGTLSADDIIPK